MDMRQRLEQKIRNSESPSDEQRCGERTVVGPPQSIARLAHRFMILLSSYLSISFPSLATPQEGAKLTLQAELSAKSG